MITKQSEELNRYASKEEIKMDDRHMKRFLTSLNVREMQIKTTMRFITLQLLEWLLSRKQETSSGEDVVKREHLYKTGGNVNYSNHYGNVIYLCYPI